MVDITVAATEKEYLEVSGDIEAAKTAVTDAVRFRLKLIDCDSVTCIIKEA